MIHKQTKTEQFYSYSKQMKRSFLLVIFILINIHFFNINCTAQDLPYSLGLDKKSWQYISGNYMIDQGLPTNILNDIHLAKDGYIWITTYNGLVRFDGTKFTVFNSQNTEIFESDAFSAIVEDKNGRLFLGTHGRGVYTYKNGVFGKLGIKKFNETIESILIDKDEKIWISTRNSGLYIFKDGIYIKMFKDLKLINSSVTAMLQTEDGVIYIGTSKDGVFSYQKGLLAPIQENHKLKDKNIYSFAMDKSGDLWIGTIRGLYRIDGKQIRAISEFKDQYITKIIRDVSDNILVCSIEGVFRKSPELEWQNLTIKSSIANFNDLVCDKEGNMWITSYREGLFFLKDSKITSYSASDGIEGGINAVIELEDNHFLIGSRPGHLYSADSTGVQPFLIKTPLSSGYLTHIFKDSIGNILVSTTEGILKITPDKSETWLTDKLGLGKIFVRMVFEDSQKNLWIGTNKIGLIKLSTDNKIVTYDKSNGLRGNMIMSISEDKEKNILIGTAGGGLSMISKKNLIKNFTTKNGFPSDTIFYTYTDKGGTTWIASNAGLIRFRNNTFFTFSKDNGFPANSIFRVLEDNNEDFWITSNSEIIRVARKALNEFASGKISNLKYKTYGKHSGIKRPEFTTVSTILKAKNGSLWFASTTILIKIEPEKLPFNNIKPPVFIERLIADNNKLNINEKIMLSPETKRLTLDYAALHYFAPSKVRFKYKLEGYENDWTETGNMRSVSYTNLSYGHYTFHVIACNNDGVWNYEGDKLSFTINRFWYETLLFRVFAVFLIFIFIFLVFKIRVRQLRKSHTKLEHIVKERTADVVSQKEEIHTQAIELKVSYIEIKEKNRELEISYEKMEQIARMDPLTDLSNRRDFLEKMAYVKATSDRNNHKFILVIGDIDNFKDFNDEYGHDCGDFVLLSVANLLKKMLRKQDYVGRWGGEEFVFLFPETDLNGGQIITEKIRKEIANRAYHYQDLSLNITMTFGICVYDKPEDIDIKLKQADEALFKGKKAGRNRVEIFSKT